MPVMVAVWPLIGEVDIGEADSDGGGQGRGVSGLGDQSACVTSAAMTGASLVPVTVIDKVPRGRCRHPLSLTVSCHQVRVSFSADGEIPSASRSAAEEKARVYGPMRLTAVMALVTVPGVMSALPDCKYR